MTQKEIETEIKDTQEAKKESIVELTKTQIQQTEQTIDKGIKEFAAKKVVLQKKDTTKMSPKELEQHKTELKDIDVGIKNTYKTEIQNLSVIVMTPENTILLLDKIRDLKSSVFAINTKGMSKEEIKEHIKSDDTKKKNRNLFDLYTSASVKNRNVWLPISEDTLIANSQLFIKDSVGIETINDILNNNTTNSYIHTLCDKSGIELIQKTGGAGFKSIKNRTPEELLKDMTTEQKEAIAKLISGTQ